MSSWGTARDLGRDAGLDELGGRRSRRLNRAERDRDRDRVRQIPPDALPDIERAVGMFPTSTCVMTSAFENRRSGIIVSKVMRCSTTPVCVCVAVPSGQRLATLIRDSRAFALCVIDRSNRLLMRKFAEDDGGLTAPAHADPFDTLETTTLVTGAPVLRRSLMAIDCEVIRHMDMEGDHEIYIGLVLRAQLSDPMPASAAIPPSATAPASISSGVPGAASAGALAAQVDLQPRRPGDDATPGPYAR